jgi:hypothetical protein
MGHVPCSSHGRLIGCLGRLGDGIDHGLIEHHDLTRQELELIVAAEAQLARPERRLELGRDPAWQGGPGVADALRRHRHRLAEAAEHPPARSATRRGRARDVGSGGAAVQRAVAERRIPPHALDPEMVRIVRRRCRRQRGAA